MSHVDEKLDEFGIDYTKLLCQSLEKHNVMYIVDIVLDVKDQILDDLFGYSSNDLVEILRTINNDETNKHKIKTAHRYKFAKIVNEIAHRKKTEKPIVRPTSKTVHFLVVTKAEEETIESIQFGQQFMKKTSLKMERLLNNLNENNQNITENLKEMCNLLKKQIDTKQKEMMKIIDDIDNMYSFQLQQQNQSTQQSAQSVAKFYKNYENCFIDHNMSQLDRKQELISSKQGIDFEIDKLMKYQNLAYNIDVVFNNNIVNRFFKKCINLVNIHIDILPVMKIPAIVNSVMKWKVPTVENDTIKILSINDNKKANVPSFQYHILYRSVKTIEDEKEEKKEEKDDNEKEKETDNDTQNMYEWNEINNLINATEYNMKNDIKPPYEVKINYTINHLLKSFESTVTSVAKPNQPLKFSFTHYTSGQINVTENGTRVIKKGGGCVRTIVTSNKGWNSGKYSWKIKCNNKSGSYAAVGAVTNYSEASNSANKEMSKIGKCVRYCLAEKKIRKNENVIEDNMDEVKNNDILTIFLDCDNWKIKFHLNNKDSGTYDLDPNQTYYPALELCCDNTDLKLIL